MFSVALLIYRAVCLLFNIRNAHRYSTSINVLHVLKFAKPRNGVKARTQTIRFFKS
jgi:hypothetical protein